MGGFGGLGALSQKLFFRKGCFWEPFWGRFGSRFWGRFGRFWADLGPARSEALPRATKIQKWSNSVVLGFLVKIFFRLLNNPKRLGLGQKSSGKTSIWPGSDLRSPKTYVHRQGPNKIPCKPQNVIKWARRGVKAIVGHR